MANHNMKAHLEPFEALLSGAKNSEVRALDGRNFQVGDTVSLAEVSDKPPYAPTGRTLERVITHVQTGYGLPAYMCVLSYACEGRCVDCRQIAEMKGEQWLAEVNKNQIILDMCMTHRHDFGLDAKESESAFPSSGMTEQQREALRRDMEQLYEHHFEDVINAQAARIAELERECERLREGKQRWKDFAELANVERQGLFAELEECRKDAERYRWLKIHAHDAGMWDDESIDAAIKEATDNAAP